MRDVSIALRVNGTLEVVPNQILEFGATLNIHTNRLPHSVMSCHENQGIQYRVDKPAPPGKL